MENSEMQRSVLGERKKLSNITNKLHNFSSRNVPPVKAGAPAIARTPLRNISNDSALPKRQTPLKNITGENQSKKQKEKVGLKLPKTEKKQHGGAKLPTGPFLLPEDLQRKAEIWAKEGIEKVHFTGDEMEAIRKKIEHEAMEKRVKMALSCRTEIFPKLSRPPYLENSPFENDGKLKIDPFEANYERCNAAATAAEDDDGIFKYANDNILDELLKKDDEDALAHFENLLLVKD